MIKFPSLTPEDIREFSGYSIHTEEITELFLVDEYLSTVDTVSLHELQLKFVKGYTWAYKMISHFKNKGRIVPNDVFGNFRVIND